MTGLDLSNYDPKKHICALHGTSLRDLVETRWKHV